jgi:hypothetical protein
MIQVPSLRECTSNVTFAEGSFYSMGAMRRLNL